MAAWNRLSSELAKPCLGKTWIDAETGEVTPGHSMGLTVTVEGLEIRNLMRLLHAAGCNQFQGYLFSRALPAAAVVESLAGRQRLQDVA